MRELAIGYPGSVVSVLSEPAAEIAREFEQRLADCSRLAFRVAMGVLRNREDAEDVAQEAFLRAFRNFHRLRERERFRAWLARITWRLAIDRWRSAGRRERRELAAEDPATSPTVESLAASRELRRHLDRAVDELPEKLRIVVILAAIQEHSLEEVASLMELPVGTVKSRLHMAKKELAEKLQWIVTGAKQI
jgi:RNA polymerase sigma-70 factor (ECF subfamily)